MEGEEFHEGELYNVEAKVEKVMHSPSVAYEDSLVRTKEVEYPHREEEAKKVPSLVHKEEQVEEKEEKAKEVPEKQNLNEDMPKGQLEEVGQSKVQLESTVPSWLLWRTLHPIGMSCWLRLERIKERKRTGSFQILKEMRQAIGWFTLQLLL